MVKRKATKSLDEWLSEGKFASAAKQPGSEIAIEPCTTFPSPTAEIAQPQVASEPPAVGTAEGDRKRSCQLVLVSLGASGI